METKEVYKSRCCDADVKCVDVYILGVEKPKQQCFCKECGDECEIVEVCEECGGDGYIEIMGDGDNFEWDVVGTAPCPVCMDT